MKGLLTSYRGESCWKRLHGFRTGLRHRMQSSFYFSAEYDVVSEVEESEDDFNLENMEKYKFMCCSVTDYGCGDQQKAIFEKPNGSIKCHLKTLFIK